MTPLDCGALDRAGLNLQAVLNLDALPPGMAAEIRQRFDPAGRFRQLILIGHGGKALWAAVRAAGLDSENPIDDFSIRTVEAWFEERFPGRDREIIYPGGRGIGLQALGQLAGWHHPSPLMIGINEHWGTWYAYRVAMLADTDLEPSRSDPGKSPCDHCQDRPCIAACPGGALAGENFELDKCVRYRREPGSSCRTTCLARLGCPVGSGHRYCEEQIRHTYTHSLRAIEAYC